MPALNLYVLPEYESTSEEEEEEMGGSTAAAAVEKNAGKGSLEKVQYPQSYMQVSKQYIDNYWSQYEKNNAKMSLNLPQQHHPQLQQAANHSIG